MVRHRVRLLPYVLDECHLKIQPYLGITILVLLHGCVHWLYAGSNIYNYNCMYDFRVFIETRPTVSACCIIFERFIKTKCIWHLYEFVFYFIHYLLITSLTIYYAHNNNNIMVYSKQNIKQRTKTQSKHVYFISCKVFIKQ